MTIHQQQWHKYLPSAQRRRWLDIQSDEFLASIEPDWTGPDTGGWKTIRLYIRWLLSQERSEGARLP